MINFRSIKFQAYYFVLAAVSLALISIINGHLVPHFEVLHDPDLLVYPLSGEFLWRQGKFALFPPGQNYGGLAFTWIRTLFAALFDFSPLAQGFFSYIFIPWSLTLTTLWALSKTVSKQVLDVVTLCTSIGFQYWYLMIGLDTYQLLIAVGLLFFGIEQRLGSFIHIRPSRAVFLLALLSGFLVSQFRPVLVFAAAFWIPWSEFNSLRNQPNKIERVFLTLGAALIALFGFLSIFGNSLGTWNGKWVRIHERPNLVWGVALISLVIAVRVFKTRPTQYWIRQFSALATGFILGILPEWLHSRLRGVSTSHVVINSETDTLFSLSRLPEALQEILLGYNSTDSYQGLLRTLALATFTWVLVKGITLSIKNRHFTSVGMATVLSLVAFVLIQVSGPAGSRYLYPLFPMLLIYCGITLEQMVDRKKQIVVALLLLASFGFQIMQRQDWFSRFPVTQVHQRIEQVHSYFLNAKDGPPRVVITDTYAEGFQYTIHGHGKILFRPNKHPWIPPESLELALREIRVGYLLTEDTYSKLSADASAQLKEWNFQDRKLVLDPAEMTLPGFGMYPTLYLGFAR